MPKAKPSTLNIRHSTKEEQQERESAEVAMRPATQLDKNPPPLLQKRKHAAATWIRLIGLYEEVEGKIITAFDEDLLAKYCLLEEECMGLDDLRIQVARSALMVSQQIDKQSKLKNIDGDQYIELLKQYNALAARVQGLDARLDGKRKLLVTIAQSLYLTPRSRAGVAPTEKPKENPDGFGKEFD